MVVYSCAHQWDAMLTCIYEAFAGKQGHKNIRLLLEPLEQYALFTEYRHVDADADKAERVAKAVKEKISPYVYREMAYCSMAYEADILENIYHVLLLGFHHGPEVLRMVQYRDIMRNREIRTRLSKEVNRFQEFLRFQEIREGLFIAHMEPKSKLVTALGPIFSDRMPSENWMIIDDIHQEAVIHPKDRDFYVQQLTQEEYQRLLQTEKASDPYSDLWKTFFHSVAIEERANSRCQQNLFPLWTRKHVTEFR